MKCMIETYIASVVFNWNNLSYKLNAQTIDFESSQFTFELLGLLLYLFFQIYVSYKVFFLELLPLKKISLTFHTIALTNYKFPTKKKSHKYKFLKQKLAQNTQNISIFVYFNSSFTDTIITHISF